MRPSTALKVLVAGSFLATAAACSEGPAERAGTKLDNAGRSISDAVNPPKGPAQSLGRSVDRTLGN